MSIASPLPTELNWLSRSYRPSAQEVDSYAEVIAAVEGADAESAAARRHEAELQLWIWRTETRQRPSRRPRQRRNALDSTSPWPPASDQRPASA